jgi:hypothetical protein
LIRTLAGYVFSFHAGHAHGICGRFFVRLRRGFAQGAGRNL